MTEREHEEREGNRPGCVCWGSNAIGHTDSDCRLEDGTPTSADLERWAE